MAKTTNLLATGLSIWSNRINGAMEVTMTLAITDPILLKFDRSVLPFISAVMELSMVPYGTLMNVPTIVCDKGIADFDSVRCISKINK